jgi:hypothetical protein
MLDGNMALITNLDLKALNMLTKFLIIIKNKFVSLSHLFDNVYFIQKSSLYNYLSFEKSMKNLIISCYFEKCCLSFKIDQNNPKIVISKPYAQLFYKNYFNFLIIFFSYPYTLI